jgi:hypothetical protein
MKQDLKRDQDLNHLNAMVMPIIAYTTIVYFMNSQLCACTIFCTACSQVYCVNSKLCMHCFLHLCCVHIR